MLLNIHNTLWCHFEICIYIKHYAPVENENEICVHTLECEIWAREIGQLSAGKRNCKEWKKMVEYANGQSLGTIFEK